MKTGTIIHRVYLMVVERGFNTSADIADEFPMSMHLASSYLAALANMGVIARTGRLIPGEGVRPMVVYEAVANAKLPPAWRAWSSSTPPRQHIAPAMCESAGYAPTPAPEARI